LNSVLVLAFAQMLAASGLTVVVILGGIVGAQLAPQPSWATVPLSLGIVMMAATTMPASFLMRRVGRRTGLIIGALIGAGGGVAAAYAIWLADFSAFCAGTMIIGSSMAFTQQYRLAACESVPMEQASRAVSYVLIGSLGAALINPQLALAAQDWFPSAKYAGSFIVVSLLYVAGAIVLTRLKMPAAVHAQTPGPDDSLGDVVARSNFRMAVFASACAYAVMSFVMTAAPLSMHTLDHHDLQSTTWVIQSHVLAMYLPSLFTGRIILRFGERNVMMAGGALLAGCAIISLTGHHMMHYWWGLVLLGVGWNLLFVAGTTLLVRSVHGPIRYKALAINEFVVFGSQACASLLAGLAVQQVGWQTLNLLTLPVLAVMVFAASRLTVDRTAIAGRARA
jgi:MFS family permease